MADALRLGIQPENHCPLLHVVDNEYQTDLKITSDIKKELCSCELSWDHFYFPRCWNTFIQLIPEY